jgi:hypothetical protein
VGTRSFTSRSSTLAEEGLSEAARSSIWVATDAQRGSSTASTRRKNMKKLVLSVAGCLLFAPALATAATFSGEIMDSQCAEGGGHASMFKKEGTNDAKACTLACVKAGGKFVLFSDSTKKYYTLDNQTKPRAFAGQQVQVSGTLNKTNNTIHVTEIKAAS